jgi:pentatricopeptide repeat protein
MKSYADRGDVAAANSIFNTAFQLGIVATLAMFTILIVGFGKLRKPDEAYQVFTRMLDSGLKPDVASVDALASAYISSGKREEARGVILQNWSAVAPPQYSGPDPRDLSLKLLIYALRSLGGAQRKGGRKPVSAFRREITRQLVRRVLKTWTGDVPRGRKLKNHRRKSVEDRFAVGRSHDSH